MYKCDICGRELFKKNSLHGYTLCSKHMHQLLKYGKFLDNTQRTNNDLNDYIIKKDIAIFNVYNQKNEYVSSFIIDTEDIEKVKYHKWRMSHTHVVTGLPAKGTQRDLAHVILDVTKEQLQQNKIVIDHINGDPLDNRKVNLRICTQPENVCNKSFMSNNTSGFIGISYRKDRDRYDPEIRRNNERCHLGYTASLEEAVYKRYFAEQLIFGEFANQEEQKRKQDFTKDLSQETKQKLEKIVITKLQTKKMLGNNVC